MEIGVFKKLRMWNLKKWKQVKREREKETKNKRGHLEGELTGDEKSKIWIKRRKYKIKERNFLKHICMKEKKSFK